jgi:hypothetical protein
VFAPPPPRENIFAYLWTLNDTHAARTGDSPQEAEACAFLNDQEEAVGGDVIEALNADHVTPAVWSRRAQHVQSLAE